jgi:catechol 2,3-dioxygenase-like lactoylglutathione lyase family enzyme
MIERVTLQVPDLVASRAFFDLLGYTSFAIPGISTELSRAIGDESLRDAPCARVVLRIDPMQALDLVEVAIDQQGSFQAPGFAALEFIVGGLDELALRLTRADLGVVGMPAPLSFSEHIRAMQVLGPNHEVVYCTEVNGPVPGFNLPSVEGKAGECFVVIAAVSDLEASRQFYASLFGTQPPAVMQSRVVAMSYMQGFKSDTIYDIAALPMSAQHYLELDQWMPAQNEGASCIGLKSSARILCVSLTQKAHHQLAELAERSWQEANDSLHHIVRGPDGELFEFINTR